MTVATRTVGDGVYRFAHRMQRLKASAIRELLKLTVQPDIISFAGGLPAPELFPVAAFADACREVLQSDGPAALQYSTTEGYLPLRTWVAEHLRETVGISCAPERILITSGSQQGLDLVAKVLLDPGDPVVIENPAYLGAIQAFDAYEPAFLTVPTDDDGIVPGDLRRVLAGADRKPKLIYMVPTFANPTGATTSLERRRAIVAIAHEFGVPIFEDDPYGQLRYSGDHLPAVTALAQAGDAIYAGTASKTIAPGMRVAWLAVPAGPLFEKAVLAKQGADLHTSTFSQRAIYEYVRAPGRFAGHVDSMTPVYRRRRDLMLATLAEAMPPGWSWTKPDGGLFLWLRGPESIDTTKLLERAVARKVAFVPGAAFWVGTDIRNTLRLNFSNASDEKIVDGIRRFAEVAAAN